MEFLLDPNIAYLLLVVGAFLGLLAVVAPGTGMLEVSAGFCLLLATYAITQLEINWWALVILVVSLVPFGLVFRLRQRGLLLALTNLGLVAGSVFLFREPGGAPAVNPVLAAIVSVAVSILVWLMITKTLEAHHARPSHNLDSVVGLTGEAKSNVHEEGSVQIAGELWSARSDKPIPMGSPVSVISREGFILVVEKSSKS
jgi:membrane-bound serine protease (ClpP class)